MSQLNKEVEQQISKALDKVADFVEAGSHPTDAVVKAARECQLGPGHARLLGTAYNTGRAAVQREVGSDAFGKAAEFELADPEIAARELGEGTVKQAAVEEISEEYSRPPTFIREQYRLQKLAEIQVPALSIKHGPLQIDNDGEFLRARGRAKRAQDTYSNCHQIATRMCDDLEVGLARTASELTTIGAPAIATLRKVAELRGETAVVTVLSEFCRRQPLLEKRAASVSPVLTDAEQRYYETARKLAADAAEVGQAMQLLETAKQAAAETVVRELRPHIPEQIRPVDPWADFNVRQLDKDAALAYPFSSVASYALGQNSARPNNNDQVEAYMAALDDPQQAQRLNGIQARSTVEGLMASDPVLKGYHPDDVLDAYNNIVQAAPRGANQQLFLQGAMRRYLAQGSAFDPDDVTGNIYKADASLQQQGQLPTGQSELSKTQPRVNPPRNRMEPLGRIWGEAGQAMSTANPKWLQSSLEGEEQAAP